MSTDPNHEIKKFIIMHCLFPALTRAILILAVLAAPVVHAQSFEDLLYAIEQAAPGSSLQERAEVEEFLPVEQAYQLMVLEKAEHIALNWVIADHYFLYGEQFKVSANGEPITLSIPEGLVKYDPIFEKDVEKHYQYIEINIPKHQLPNTSEVQLQVTSQGCADAGLCYPPNTQGFLLSDGLSSITPLPEITADAIKPVSLSEIVPQTPPLNTSNTAAITMLAFALLGGLILNLMPCVLPVLSLKALSLSRGQNLQQQKRHGWSYSLGVITTFVAIAGILLATRAAGQSVGWGFQLQTPWFVSTLIFLFFVMGLALSGYIEIGSRWMNTGQHLTQGHGLKQSYFTGVLAAVVASPCTAPFMASALGYAIAQPNWLALSIFAALGLGMALPFLALSHLPQLSRFLPKPGPWMETFKQALAFPLYLTAIWLLWVLGRQLGNEAVMLMLLGTLGIVFIYWLGHRNPSIHRLTGIFTLVVIIALSWLNSQSTTLDRQTTTSVWEPYSEQRLQQLRQEGKAVFINITADWCITCLANEKRVFTEQTLATMKNQEIHLLKGDWTHYNPAITQLLEKYQHGGVPLYLLFPKNPQTQARVLPQILSQRGFKKAIADI